MNTEVDMRWTPEQAAAHQAKFAPNTDKPKPEGPSVPEKEIHRLILLECNRRGFLALHGSMAHRTFRTIGEPDITILMPAGRVLFVEAKTRSGRISEEQEAFARRAQLLGHTVHIVRSFEEFIQLLK